MIGDRRMTDLVLQDRLRSMAVAAILAGAGCGGPSGTDSAAVESAQRATAGSLPSDAGDASSREAARVVLDRRARRDVPDERRIGGFVYVSDDQLTNRHYVSVSFHDGPQAVPCGDVVPIPGGGECFLYRACEGAGTDPGTPIAAPSPVDVGVVEVSARYDTVRLETVPGLPYYGGASRPGPFWRGDGDEVSISFTGVPGETPPFAYRVRAPVGDVIASPAAAVERGGSLRFGWDYADGARPAVGDLLIRLYQNGASGALACTMPLASRAVEIPPALLQDFVPGPAFLRLESVALGTAFAPVATDHVRLTMQLQSTVDSTAPGGLGMPPVVFE
jgi:hypothetical protein